MLKPVALALLALALLAAAPALALDVAEDCTQASPRTMALCQRVQDLRARAARRDQQSAAERDAERARSRQRTAAARASLEAMRRENERKLATMPLDQHTVINTWTDPRGHTHRTATTCTFYQSKTTCHTR